MTADTSLHDQAECESFIRRAIENPEDESHLLAFSAWLDGHEQPDAARVMRQHVADCQQGGEPADQRAGFRQVHPPAGVAALSNQASRAFYRLCQEAAFARWNVFHLRRVFAHLSRPSQTAWAGRTKAD